LTDQRKIAWVVAGVVLLVVLVLFVPDRLRQELRPEPVTALVAVQARGEAAARTGRVELAPGTAFALHAVLEARGRSGERVFFTEAPALVVDGSRWDGDSLRPWPGPEKAKVLWFSVEGPRPFVKIEDASHLDGFELREVYRSDWPRSWSIPGTVRPFRDATAAGERILAAEPFGTLCYQVKIELFGPASQLVPVATYRSTAASEATAEPSSFSMVVSSLGGPLELPSRVFGLPQIALPVDLLRRETERLERWFEEDVAFTYLLLLRAMAERAGLSWDAVDWHGLELGAGLPWGQGAPAAGDLLRAGDRIVVLYQDRGEPGVIDYGDLCLDFLEGAAIRRLREVFSGEGLVEWTSLEVSE
jgi:hypothetical protein